MKCLIIDHNKGIWSKTWNFLSVPPPNYDEVSLLCLCVTKIKHFFTLFQGEVFLG